MTKLQGECSYRRAEAEEEIHEQITCRGGGGDSRADYVQRRRRRFTRRFNVGGVHVQMNNNQPASYRVSKWSRLKRYASSPLEEGQ
jgi:hypothetical protein